MADQVSDAIVDAYIRSDPSARLGVETVITRGLVLVAMETKSSVTIDVADVARGVITDVGYDETCGVNLSECEFRVSAADQSPEISDAIDRSQETRTPGGQPDLLGAGDQGLVFGYACDDTPDLMPLPIWLAHRLTKRLDETRHTGTIPYLRPDGKSQVTVLYEDGDPIGVDTILLAAQHDPGIPLERLRADLEEQVVQPLIPPSLGGRVRVLCNPAGSFVLGGPLIDTGLTGRKTAVDTYGGFARHGGGAFSGKDPTKIDRSAAYAARQVAKAIVASELARRCEVQVAYAIGHAKPVSIFVETFGSSCVPPGDLSTLVDRLFDLRPGPIIESLALRRPIYRPTATYGHFGRTDLGVSWEEVDKYSEQMIS